MNSDKPQGGGRTVVEQVSPNGKRKTRWLKLTSPNNRKKRRADAARKRRQMRREARGSQA